MQMSEIKNLLELKNRIKSRIEPLFRIYFEIARELIQECFNSNIRGYFSASEIELILKVMDILVRLKHPHYLLKELQLQTVGAGNSNKEIPEDVRELLDETIKEWEMKEMNKNG